MLDNLKNEELEKHIISSILSSTHKIEEQELLPEYFYFNEHSTTFEAFVKMYESGLEITYISAKQKLLEMGHDYGSYLLDLIDYCMTQKMNYESACKQLRELYKKRNLLKTAEIIQTELKSDKDYESVQNNVLDQILSINKKDDSIINLRDEIESTLTEIDDNSTKVIEVGLKTGFDILDRYVAFRRGNLVVLGAKTGCGKTTIALGMANHISKTKKVCFFSLEMTKQEIKYKVLSSTAQVEYWKLETGKLNAEESMRVGDAIQRWKNGNLMIYESCDSKLTVNNIRTKCKNLLAGDGLDLVIVDYLQLLTDKGYKSKYEEVTAISQKLKMLASELQIPIIALSQFSREDKRYSDTIKKPTLFDFKDSGSIENDANIVLLLYRSDMTDYSKVNIIVAKNRLGPKGEIECKFYETKSTIQETGVEISNI